MQGQLARPVALSVNGETTETLAATLAELVAELGHAEAAVATARNGEFVPRSARAVTKLAADDKIEILAPRQGG
jgi:sulfur carrier protein